MKKLNTKYPRNVYRIILDGKTIYVGSTASFYNKKGSYMLNKIEYRLDVHKHSKIHSILVERKDDLIVDFIDYIRDSKDLDKEQKWIEFYEKEGNLLNKEKALFLEWGGKYGTYNKDYTREYYREYRKNNKEKIDTINKNFYMKNNVNKGFYIKHEVLEYTFNGKLLNVYKNIDECSEKTSIPKSTLYTKINKDFKFCLNKNENGNYEFYDCFGTLLYSTKSKTEFRIWCFENEIDRDMNFKNSKLFFENRFEYGNKK